MKTKKMLKTFKGSDQMINIKSLNNIKGGGTEPQDTEDQDKVGTTIIWEGVDVR